MTGLVKLQTLDARTGPQTMKLISAVKPRPDHQLYLAVLRNMTPEQRLLKAFELTEFSRQLFLHGLRRKFAEKSEADIKKMYLERLERCHDRNW